MIDKIIAEMSGFIDTHGLELLQRYPDDLLKIDRQVLEQHAVPGATIAWMVGDSHTHMAVLGIHPSENLCVTYHTNLCANDRFCLLTVGEEKFSLCEISRDKYQQLSSRRIDYYRDGSGTNFAVRRGAQEVGRIALVSCGTLLQPHVKATIAPVPGVSQRDLASLGMWASYGIRELARTLFVRETIEWKGLDSWKRAA